MGCETGWRGVFRLSEVLDRESLQRIIDWLDTNAMFYGDYSWNKAEWRKPSPEGETTLREHIRDTFGRYVSEEIVDSILAQPNGLHLGGKRAIALIENIQRKTL